MWTLKECHPAVSLVSFALIIGLTMLFQQPLLLLLSLLCSMGCRLVFAAHKKETAKGMLHMGLLFLAVGLLNPVFVHEGLTVLFYLNDKPFTLEALVRGLSAAAMLWAAVEWFGCLSEVLTSDKWIFLFGRFAPAISLILSMTLRLSPRLKRQYEAIRQAQAGIGMDIAQGSFFCRVKSALRVTSILITWALENGVDTADSMQARGYGLHGKTSAQTRRFSLVDGLLLCVMLLLGGIAFWQLEPFSYYPRLGNLDAVPLWGAAAFLLLGILPVLLEFLEEMKWRYLRSKI